jgi:hypothetical protein
MELATSAAAVLSLTLSLARTGSQLHAILATGDVVAQISRRNRVLSAGCAIAGLSCRSLCGVETWLACASLLNAAASVIALCPHPIACERRRARQAANTKEANHE